MLLLAIAQLLLIILKMDRLSKHFLLRTLHGLTDDPPAGASEILNDSSRMLDEEEEQAEGEDTLPLRIVAIFAILCAGLIGGMPPLFLKVGDSWVSHQCPTGFMKKSLPCTRSVPASIWQ